MRAPSRHPAVFGPFDGDFDPFEDDEDLGPLVTFGRTRVSQNRTAKPPF